MNNENLSIGFIGAGRVGFTLGRYFFAKNLEISGYFSNTYEHACQAAELTHSKACKSIKELAKASQVIFITVPDRCIYDVYLTLKKCEIKDKILCHCSGSLSAEVFEDIEQVGAYGYSVHPIFAVSDKLNSYKEISKAFFTVEGDERKMPVIQEIFDRIGNPFQIISAENKHKYHASLVMSSNLVIGLYRIALSLLEECGFSHFAAEEALKPLFLNNAENLCQKGIVNALTGPIDRNDVDTVKKHLSALDDENAWMVYQSLSKELINIAKEKYPDRNYNQLEITLEKEHKNI